MKAQQTIGVLLGFALIVIGLAADRIGLGQFPGIGLRQIGLAVAGVIVIVASFVIGRTPPES